MSVRLVIRITIALSLLTGSAFGQMTLNISDAALNFGATDTTLFTSRNVQIDWNSFASGTGGGFLWDLAAIPFNSPPQVTTIIELTPDPMFRQFPHSNAARFYSTTNWWEMLRIEGDKVSNCGTLYIDHIDSDPYIDTIFAIPDEPELQYQFPVAEGSSWVGKYHYISDFGDYDVEVYDSTLWTVDAWGVIRYNNHERDALRLHGSGWRTSILSYPGHPPIATTISVELLKFLTKEEFDVVTVSRSSAGAQTAYSASVKTRLFQQLCGDVNNSGRIDVSDAVYLLNYVFASGPLPEGQSAADLDCNGKVNIGDIVFLISFIFAGGDRPCHNCP